VGVFSQVTWLQLDACFAQRWAAEFVVCRIWTTEKDMKVVVRFATSPRIIGAISDLWSSRDLQCYTNSFQSVSKMTRCCNAGWRVWSHPDMPPPPPLMLMPEGNFRDAVTRKEPSALHIIAPMASDKISTWNDVAVDCEAPDAFYRADEGGETVSWRRNSRWRVEFFNASILEEKRERDSVRFGRWKEFVGQLFVPTRRDDWRMQHHDDRQLESGGV
jgi:hypothetical protein